MLWTIFVIFLFLWLPGLVSGYTMGGVIHILLVIAIIVLGSDLFMDERYVAIWTLAGEGEVFGKEVVSRAQKDFAESYDTFSRKGLVMNHFTNKFTERRKK